ncbi:hypothetical protein FOMPIDRAFT_89842 [Fomitopsis schrenkii]|uniref:Uncharacterized protein n=1 Tax=Fomitopsis schrenkii TaxID=2126942 RepID=S8F271_FOMSC|nr:hypothetical protein FOMPIDRAFT_89842 [Fomitopsis schrenkii]
MPPKLVRRTQTFHEFSNAMRTAGASDSALMIGGPSSLTRLGPESIFTVPMNAFYEVPYTPEAQTVKEQRLQAQTLAARPEARRFHMRLGDIAFLPEFRTVVLAPRLVNDDNTAPLRAQFRNAVEQWERRARGELCRLIFDYTASHPEFGVDPLQLATTKFPCMCYRHKNDTLFYPAVLAHRCLLDVIPPRTSNMYEEAVLAQLTSSFSWSHESNRVWTHDDIFVDGTSEHSRRLIELGMQILYQDRSETFGNWRLATPDERKAGQEHERQMRQDAAIWGCGACQGFKDRPQSDVLLHIHKSITSQTLRQTTSSKYMWKQSFRSLPWHLPFPEGIIEPAWATLLFTKVCTACGTQTFELPKWEFNARFCVICALTKIIDSNDPLGDVLPRDKKHLAAHIPLAVFTPRQRASPYERTKYLRSEMEEVIDRWDKLLGLGDEDALAMFIGKCILRVQRAPMHIARCTAWSREHAQAVIAEEKALMNKYLKAIVSSLQELGWGDELDRMQTCNYAPLREHKDFGRPQELTDSVWQTMSDKMNQCMEKAREDRLVRERLQVLKGRWTPLEVTLKVLSDLPEARAYNIGVVEIALMPEIREIVDVPDGVSVDQASFAEVRAKFGDMVERWKIDQAIKLRELIMRARPVSVQPKPTETKRKGRRGKAKAQPEVDVLELATTRFRCNYCNGDSVALYWPGVLAHACLRNSLHSEGTDTYERFVYAKMRPCVWRTDRLTVAEPSEAAKVVIRLCGKDPEQATVEEMNALNVMLVKGDGEIRTWRNAILFDDVHGYVSRWSLATPDQLAMAQKLLPEIEMQRSRYICVSCSNQRLWHNAWWYDDALQHLRQEHGLAHPSLKHKFLVRQLAPDSLFIAGAIKMKLPTAVNVID